MMGSVVIKKTQTPKKICFFALNAYPVFTGIFDNKPGEIGGSELQQSLIAKELVKRQCIVSFIVFGNNNSLPEVVDHVNFYKTIKKNFKLTGIFSYLFCLISFWKSMEFADSDIYYQRGAGRETGIVALFCLLKRKKFVFAMSSDMDINGTFYKNAKLYEKLLMYIGLKSADVIIVQNNFQKVALKEKFNRDSIVIKNIISIKTLDSRPPKKNPFVLWVGTIRPEWKQPELFLKLAKSIPTAKFQMIGGAASDDVYYQRIKKEAEKIPNLEFLGFIPYTQIDRYFAESSVFVNTSTYEGFPNTFLQAWAYSNPVVSLNVDPDEIICNQKLGIHSKTFEKLVFDVNGLLNNETMRMEMGKNGRKYVEEAHDINVIVPKYIELLINLV